MYLQDNLMLILSEETEEEEVGISQVSLVVEEVAAEEEVNLDMKELEEIDLDMEKVKVEEAAETVVVAVAAVVEAVV